MVLLLGLFDSDILCYVMCIYIIWFFFWKIFFFEILFILFVWEKVLVLKEIFFMNYEFRILLY